MQLYGHACSWSFTTTKENYERLIKPWVQNYNYYRDFVPVIRDYEETRARVSCSHCGTQLLDSPTTSEAGIRRLLKKNFEVETEKTLRITRKERELREWTYTHVVKESSHPPPYMKKPWYPPMTIKRFFRCPECGKQIVLSYERTVDSHFDYRDNFKQLLDDKCHDINVEVYTVVVESRRWQLFFAACQYLTWDGLQSLVNAFTAWAGPQITEIEQEITGLVSKQTFQEFFREARAKEEEEE